MGSGGGCGRCDNHPIRDWIKDKIGGLLKCLNPQLCWGELSKTYRVL